MPRSSTEEELTDEQIIRQQRETIKELTHALEHKQKEAFDLKNSLSFRLGWALSLPFRFVYNGLFDKNGYSDKRRLIGKMIFVAFQNPFSLLRHINYRNFSLLARALREEAPRDIFRNFLKLMGIQNAIPFENEAHRLSFPEQYALFLSQNKLTDQAQNKIRETCQHFAFQPLISIVTPVYNCPPVFLEKCIQSVRNQLYTNWELCFHDDASTDPGTIACLQKWQQADSRIKLSLGKENEHISSATNAAISLASGTYIGFLDHDDELSPDALYEVVKALNAHPQLDFLYSDEDKLEADGSHTDPYFKPAFSIDLFLSYNYICHFAVMRKALGDQLGWLRTGFEGSQDYDLLLRMMDHEPEIHHIPKVLYHWRKMAGSTAALYEHKGYASDTTIQALEEYLERNEIPGRVEPSIRPGSFRIIRELQAPYELISIIIPFRDKVPLLRACVESILQKTHYPHFEIILVSNSSKEAATFSYLAALKKRHSHIRIVEYNQPFNYSKINNWAVAEHAKGKYILLLNNDVEAINPGWLTEMSTHIQRKEVGAVGAKLLYDDNSLQHAGVVVGLGGVAGHAFKHLMDGEASYFNRADIVQNLSACTAACLMVKRELFLELGGLEEDFLQIAFNDIDLCLKIREAGYLITYTPFAKLYHHESRSRGYEDTHAKQERFRKEVLFFQQKWRSFLAKGDPYYNPNFSLSGHAYDLKIGEERIVFDEESLAEFIYD